MGDETKRKTYDRTGMKDGEDPFGAAGGFWGAGKPGNQHFDEEIFEDFASFFNMDGQGGRTRNVRGADIVINLDITFMESVNGVNKEI